MNSDRKFLLNSNTMLPELLPCQLNLMRKQYSLRVQSVTIASATSAPIAIPNATSEGVWPSE